MPLLYLAVAVALMFVGGMLISLNPLPLSFNVGWGQSVFEVRASILEVLGGAMIVGAAVVALLTIRSRWHLAREHRKARADAERLRAESTALRREAADARSQANLFSAQLSEVREAYLALEAEARPLLTMRSEKAVADSAPPPAVGVGLRQAQVPSEPAKVLVATTTRTQSRPRSRQSRRPR